MKTSSALFLAAAVVASVTRPAAADTAVELEMQLLGRAGGSMGGPGGGGGGLIGLPLGSHAVLMTGFEITGNGGGQMQSWALGVPLALKVYVRTPAERKLVPVVRLGTGYYRSSGVYGPIGIGLSGEALDFTTHYLQAGASAGVAYFITSHFGLGMDAGVSYMRRLATENACCNLSAGWSIDARWAANMTFRL